MTRVEHGFAINFHLLGNRKAFAFRRLFAVPRVGEVCTFNEKHYDVVLVQWCLDDDATDRGTRINIEMEERNDS